MPTAGVSGYLCSLSLEGHVLAENQEITLTENQAEIDLSNRDSGWWQESTPGLRDWEISGSGLHIANDAAREILDWHWNDRTPSFITVIITLADGTITKTGECYVTNITYPGPHDAAGTITFTLKGTHALTISAS